MIHFSQTNSDQIQAQWSDAIKESTGGATFAAIREIIRRINQPEIERAHAFELAETRLIELMKPARIARIEFEGGLE